MSAHGESRPLPPVTSTYPERVSEPPEVVAVDRLTMVSRVSWLELDEPVFLQAGDRYWADVVARVVVVETSRGEIRRLPTKPTGPSTLR
jgi:hypothetical protein